jgi:hypothetical protein
MGLFDSPDVPHPTDPNIVAANQQALNTKAGQASQQGSMVNQVNPYGSSTYTQSGTSSDGTPLYTSTVNLSPENQALLKTLQGTQATAGTQASNLLTGANYGAAQPGDVIGNSTSGLVKTAMGGMTSYLDPYFQTQRDQADTKLRNQGFAPGQKGYDNAMRGIMNSQNNTVTGFLSQIEPQMFNQSMQSYMLPASLSGSLASFGAPKDPSWLQTPQLSIAPADLTSATANYNAANQKAYESENAQHNSMMSGIFGMGSALMGAAPFMSI